MNTRRLYRSRADRVLTGIAGGMAEYLEVDPTIVRILWVLAAIFTKRTVYHESGIRRLAVLISPPGNGRSGSWPR